MPRWTFEDDNLPILVEVTPISPVDQEDTGGYMGDTSLVEDAIEKVGEVIGGAVTKVSDKAMKDAFDTIFKMAIRTGWLVKDIQQYEDQQALSGAEVEFSVNFVGEGQATIGKIGAEANMKVKLTWTLK
jgi:hypothetical protein